MCNAIMAYYAQRSYFHLKYIPVAITGMTEKVQAVSETNTQVREEMKCGAYHCYSPGDWISIGMVSLCFTTRCGCSSKVLLEDSHHVFLCTVLSVSLFSFPVKNSPNSRLPDDVIHMKASLAKPAHHFDPVPDWL